MSYRKFIPTSTHPKTRGKRASKTGQPEKRLSKEVHYPATHVNQKNINDYIEEARKTVVIGGHEVRLFAPFRHEISAFQTLLSWQKLVLALFLVMPVLAIVFLRYQALVFAIIIITVQYLADLLFTFILSIKSLGKTVEKQIDNDFVQTLIDFDWPRYTILCPLYHETSVVPQFIRAMQDLDYPTDKLQILFLTEEDDFETRALLQAANLPSHFTVLTVPSGRPKTKPRACNFGLLHAKGEYVVIYDAEDVPEPLQLKKAVLTFAVCDPEVACVQAKLNFYNAHQNLLTRLFTAEYSLWFDLTLPGLQSTQLPIPLGGTSNHFRAEALRALGAWDPFNVTEDCELGMRLAHNHYKTVVLDSTTYEEANSRFKNWLRQRSRWIKGYMQTYLVYMRQPLRYLHPRNWREFLSIQLVVGGKVAVLFINPVMWGLLATYILYYAAVNDIYHKLFIAPIFYMGMTCLVFGNFLYGYAHLVGCMKRRHYELTKWIVLIPLYWGMTSIAAFIALFQLIFKPHYWEKTQHGLHLSAKASHILRQAVLEQVEIRAIVEEPTMKLTSSQGIEMQRETLATQPTMKLAHSVSSGDIAEEVTAALEPTGKLTTLAFLRALDRQREVLAAEPTSILSDEPLKAFEKQAGINTVMKREGSQARSLRKYLYEDPWLVAVLIVACSASISALVYCFQNHLILGYNDAYSHLLIARRIFDSATPGLSQLGGVWLPLPHLLMIPFIWNDYLWHTGLAGSFVSMPCYIVTSVYLFLLARRVTRNSTASFIGTLLFMLNPNILYLQTTPLSELVLIASSTMACYHLFAWVQSNHLNQLILTALGTLLASLSRYDGWFIFLVFIFIIAVTGLIKRYKWSQIEGYILTFATLGGLGIGLWLLWGLLIFNDPLYFQRGPYSSQAMQGILLQAHALYTYHDLWQSIRFFVLDSIENSGLVIFLLGVLGFIAFIFHHRFSAYTVAGLALVTPFVFYVVSLYTGQAIIYLPSAVPASAPALLHSQYGLYNTRYGVELVAPIAFFVSILASGLHWPISQKLVKLSGVPWQVLLVITILAQTIATVLGGVISLEDGRYGIDCAPPSVIAVYLAQHYDGGSLLEDLYRSQDPGIDFKNVIYEGSGSLWEEALKKPDQVEWIILNPVDQDDLVTRAINVNSPTFLSEFSVIAQEPNGRILFRRKGLPALPTRPVPDSLLNEHASCGASGPISKVTFQSPLPSSPGSTPSSTTQNLKRPDFQMGIAFPQWDPNGYSNLAWLRGLKDIHEQTSARWIEMPVILYQSSLTSTGVVRGANTPTLTAFTEGIRAAHNEGYRVFVVPVLIVKGRQSWAGSIHFSTLQAEQRWFENYWLTFKPYVEIASREKVEQLAIGTEFEWLQEYAPDELWNGLIANFHGVFSGTLTYDTNWTTLKGAPAGWLHNVDLKMIGVSAYFPLVDTPSRVDPKRANELWKSKVRNILDQYKAMVNKPIFISEIGYRSTADAFYRPYAQKSAVPFDPEEQAAAYNAALINTIPDLNIAGIFFWAWDNVGALSIHDLPAAATLHSWYNSPDA